MIREEFERVLKGATTEQKDALEASHWRYMSLIGIVSGEVEEAIVVADRVRFPQMARRCKDDLPIFDDAQCVEFMAEITGLPEEFCEAWKDKDFYELNGDV